MASVRSIAEEVGVSTTTVSRALNNDPVVSKATIKKVLSAANRNGYVSSVGRRVTTNVALAYTDVPTLGDPFDAAVLSGVVKGLDEHRFDVVVLNVRRDKLPGETYTQFFMRKNVRGVILRTTEETREVCCKIAEEGFPHVVLSERFESPNVNYIDCDSRADTMRAIEYLISLGHTRIAFGMHNIPDQDHVDRLQAYEQAMAKHGLPIDEDIVYRHRCSLEGGATILKMISTMSDRPTAVFMADPLLALGAIRQAQQTRIAIPDELSLVAFDDTDMRYSVFPTLTSVCQDAVALGRTAARQLTHNLVRRSVSAFRVTIPTFFEIHESTDRCRKAATATA